MVVECAASELESSNRERSMRRSFRRKTVSLPLLFVLGTGTAMALEAPLSRASFERALAEGRACESTRSVGPYLVAKATLGGVAQSMMDNALEYPDTTYLVVTVRLETPYLRVRRLACQARLGGPPLDEAELWKAIRNSPTVSLWVETQTTHTANGSLPADVQLERGLTSDEVRTGGPRVQRVSLRRGSDRDAATVEPVSEGGVAYDFPAEALQGKGPFYILVHTESPSIDQTLKLKPSALAKP
jgi:hypothetical protein